jgi:hypothetical protein
MSNTPSRRGRAPRTDAEWAREMQRRISSLESATSVRIGPWVLSVGDDGGLIATSEGRKVVLSDLPDTSAP